MDKDKLNDLLDDDSKKDCHGSINFKKSRKRRMMKNIIAVIIIIAVSATVGGVTAAYIVKNKLADNPYSTTNKSIFEQKKDEKTESMEQSKTADNNIVKVAKSLGPAVVGVSNKAEGFMGMQDQGQGSGVIFQSDGYIVTNNHVIDGAQKITVKLSNGKILEAKVIGKDPRSDLAVIKINSKNLPVAKFGDSSKVKVGETAIAIGNPISEEFAGTVTSGIISAVNREIKYQGAVYKTLQTDAAINPGNSGGALANEKGEVIGINSLKTGDSEGIGLAISINEVKSIVEQLVKNGKVARPYIGVGGVTAYSRDLGISGVLVKTVEAGAKSAGIKPRDLIVELDKKKVEAFEDISGILDKHKIGDSVECKVLRQGKEMKFTIKLSELK